jgi:hypothetical protein
MKYVVRTFISMFLFAFCWVAVGYGLYQALQVGTCASGGPYLIAQECPDGMGWIFAALMAGYIIPFFAAGLYLTRGTPPGGPTPDNAGIIIWFWTGLFWSSAVGAFLGVWGPDANPGPGGKEGGLIVGFLFAIMGAGGIFAAKLGTGTRRKKRLAGIFNSKTLKAAGAAAQAMGITEGQARIDALDKLRDTGTLTDDEFETLKNKIARED